MEEEQAKTARKIRYQGDSSDEACLWESERQTLLPLSKGRKAAILFAVTLVGAAGGWWLSSRRAAFPDPPDCTPQLLESAVFSHRLKIAADQPLYISPDGACVIFFGSVTARPGTARIRVKTVMPASLYQEAFPGKHGTALRAEVAYGEMWAFAIEPTAAAWSRSRDGFYQKMQAAISFAERGGLQSQR